LVIDSDGLKRLFFHLNNHCLHDSRTTLFKSVRASSKSLNLHCLFVYGVALFVVFRYGSANLIILAASSLLIVLSGLNSSRVLCIVSQ
jgi:hypothetical protein